MKPTLYKTVLVCKLAQVPPEIWMNLPVEAKKLLLNELKRHQEDVESKKISSSSDAKDTTEIPDRDKSNFSIPDQYAKVKNAVKREEEIYLEEAINTSNVYESTQDAHASIGINNTFYDSCMNLLFLPASYQFSILDGGVDTCVLGKGWELLSIHLLPIVSAITALETSN
jgi:hypothetical protein